ncbi:GP46-like surface antigen, putative [Bodo saltans]|uniref:GP46-like surface antigen, putative n=1 Tax=Bodo saltans TaxID=75058 RepID=A0A0S4JQB6_BODSA|nr:GP46-like surface antigen, putative [Bodo saltans]|eukprot:CUG92932.1 GP46-like surface antigen, putative [Bodo saltans]
MSSLATLYIFQTNVSGTLPSSWKHFVAVSDLHLRNMLVGPLPESWSQMVSLQNLRLDHNNLNSSLPNSWAALQQVTAILLDSNFITGTLPSSWSTMTSLQQLTLSSNSIGGMLPSSWTNLRSLTQLQISDNRLVGSLPPAWVSIPSLQQLYLQNNCLTGTMPTFSNARLQLPSAINVCNTKIRGSGPNVSRCPGYQWPHYCNDMVSQTRSDSEVRASATWSGPLTSPTMSNTVTHSSSNESLSLSRLSSATVWCLL